MNIEIATKSTAKVAYLEVRAGVRYWEDGTLNGRDDEEGQMPCRDGNAWAPVIDLETGQIIAWPEGAEASIHYKVCDDGEYWLLDENRQRIAKWASHYVPNEILCIGDNGYGDYIILEVGGDGRVVGWKAPQLDSDEWVAA